jgi:hypothetical protein
MVDRPVDQSHLECNKISLVSHLKCNALHFSLMQIIENTQCASLGFKHKSTTLAHHDAVGRGHPLHQFSLEINCLHQRRVGGFSVAVARGGVHRSSLPQGSQGLHGGCGGAGDRNCAHHPKWRHLLAHDQWRSDRRPLRVRREFHCVLAPRR